MISLISRSLILVLVSATSASAADLPDHKTRLEMFDHVVAEYERLDGEGLPARANRPEKWRETIARLRKEMDAATTKTDVGRVFDRLDATYPNLHAHLTLADDYDHRGQNRPKHAIRFRAEVVDRNQKSYAYRIGSIDTDMMKTFKETTRPAMGDEVVAIDGRPMKEWSRENFIFCKLPLREQCESNIFDHFRKGLLFRKTTDPIEYTLRRNGRTWTIKAPVEVAADRKTASTTPTPAPEPECPVEDGRYDGFKVVHRGLNICVFESEKWPGVAVLRLASFRYRNLPESSKVKSVRSEVEALYEAYWKERAPKVKKLIIDVIDNGGGDTPVAWYELFLDKPFQEMFVQFKKLPELENAEIREKLFYEDAGKEIWFKRLKETGRFAKIRTGDFLPSIPQFCATEDKSCEEGLFQPRSHGFKGEIRILVNEWCISSCTGFVWQLKDKLGKRVKLVGMPDSGDSAYARLYLDLYVDPSRPEGYRTEVTQRVGRTNQELPEGALLRQQIAVTRSTDSRDRVISAKPTAVDVWVPIHYREFDDSWEAKAFKAALKN